MLDNTSNRRIVKALTHLAATATQLLFSKVLLKRNDCGCRREGFCLPLAVALNKESPNGNNTVFDQDLLLLHLWILASRYVF